MTVKVCHISTVHQAMDVRIFYKECKSLSQGGYDVSLVVTHDKEEVVEGIHIIPLSNNQSRLYRFFVKGWSALNKALKTKAEIYHFHDPELIPLGRVLKLLGKKVIYDVHEDVPMQILTKEWINPSLRKAVSRVFNWYEKGSSKRFDRVVAARPDIGSKFKSNNVSIVRNMPVLNIIQNVSPANVEVTKPVVIYAGGITEIRGIKEIIDAVGLLDGLVEFWLFGPWDYEEYKDRCKKSNGWRYTKDMGYVPLKEVYSYMKKASIGIVNFLPAPNHLYTMPNKPFEYMTCGLPVIMSSFAYWKELFSDHVVYAEPSSPENIANAIKSIVNDKDYARKLGEEGKKYILENFSWESEQEILLREYEKLV